MKTYIVFGASGFVGGTVHRALSAQGLPVQGLGSRDADLSDAGQTAGLADRLAAGAVWVVASVARAKRPEAEKAAMMDNIRMADHLGDLLTRCAPAQVIYLSSIDVYGREGLELPLTESSPLRPRNYYAVGKLAAEGILEVACRDADVPLSILRLPGVYGPGDTQRGPVRSFLRAALRNEPVTIHGNGEQRRDLLYVGDVAEIVRALDAGAVTGVYNAVTGHTLSLNEMLAVIEGLTGRKLDVRYQPEAAQMDLAFGEPLLLRRLPGLTLTPLEKGIARTYTCLVVTGDSF